jgi:glycosyltransferase involved in cell wall biosynthesis
MRVLLVNTSEHTGGAAIAASRLRDALGNNGVKATMLVGHKDSELITVAEPHQERLLRLNFLRERLTILRANRLHRYRLFETDAARYGLDITGLKEFQEADIIHLHWINQGFLSLSGIRRIIASGKPVVWTMHDMWPFTGICHYAGECDRYKDSCGRCPLLWGGGSTRDLSHRVFLRKKHLYEGAPRITFVSCSDWLAATARESRLLEGKQIYSIPNPIDTRLYAPATTALARTRLALPLGKTLLLFAAFRVTNKIKGIDYLVEALTRLTKEHPDIASNMALVAVGKDSDALRSLLPVKVYPMGYVSNERRMIDIYNACNLFLTPTLQDNLPNTVMEAMACGVPCVAFRVGGLPQMIDHLDNGYLAAERDAADFAEGIMWSLRPDNYERLRTAARQKVTSTFSDAVIARRFSDLYLSLIGGRES